MKVSMVKLSSCSGCQVAMLDTYEKFFEFADSIDYATILTDSHELKECDVVLVEGAVRTSEELNVLKDAREKAKILVAFGSCAALGGISSMANLFSGEEIIKDVYGTQLKEVPEFFDEALPVDRFVDVDYYLPGCPPPPNLIYVFLSALIRGEEPKKIDSPVCAECGRVVKFNISNRIKKCEEAEEGICLLSQGFLCLGSVTRGGCGAVCVKAGVPCKGCRGPTPKVMMLPCEDNLSVIEERLERAGINNPKIHDVASIYAFVFGSDLREKRISKIKEIMRRVRYDKY